MTRQFLRFTAAFAILLTCDIDSGAGASGAGEVPSTAGHPKFHAGQEWERFGQPSAPNVHARAVTITATDAKFIPARVAVHQGETIRFVVTNIGALAHEFVIGDAGFHAQHEREMRDMPGMTMEEPNGIEIEPGKTRSLSWRFSKRGNLSFACDIPGHQEAGMHGALLVN